MSGETILRGRDDIKGPRSRVERWRGGVGFGIFWVGVSPSVSHQPHAVLRFHLPLIKPDVRFSRIRLSDKVSCVRPRKGASFGAQPDQAQLLLQAWVGES